MTKLSEHFTLEEATHSDTAIRQGINNQPNDKQLENMKIAAEGMEKVRAALGKPISVNSWLRLPEVNVAVGGSKVSSHMDGWAIDFTSSFGNPLAAVSYTHLTLPTK
jgi:zinc D-Ala-D-Ala carboxypeptidase